MAVVFRSSRLPLLASLLAGAAALAAPAALLAQDGGWTWPALDLRGGFMSYGDVSCNAGEGWAVAGLDVRTRGPLIASVAVDASFLPNRCLLETSLGGTFETPLDDVGPRLSASLGYAFLVDDRRVELTAGVGRLRVRRPATARTEWQPWYGGAVAFRAPSRFGIDLELGTYRLTRGVYVTDPWTAVPRNVGELSRWNLMWRVGLVVPIA
jgi:hypothetical protein